MRDYTIEQAIQALEDLNQIKFSPEQLAILRAPHDHPTVVNACAGSGKTTIFVYKAILNMLTGASNGHDTYGITFSKDAQLEMRDRFERIRSQLVQAGMKTQALVDSVPKFKTFHALFFGLLKSYQPGLKILAGPDSNRKIRFSLYRIISRSRYEMDNHEVMNQMFSLRNELINRGWSVDGLNVPDMKGEVNPIQSAAADLNIPGHSEQFYEDYVDVVRTYQDLKAEAGLVDFTDMKVILYQNIFQDESARQYYLQQMKQYKYVFLDEFQDIDNLQWKLIKLLLSPQAKKNLFVIGDDDQAIYGFRGGSAKYIIHFKDSFPDAKSYNLSTNYRTGGHILATTRDMITSNPVRIDKDLYAHRKEQGKIYVHLEDDKHSLEEDPIFQQLLKVTKDPNIPSHDIAVLVRHNSTRSMVADFLANHEIYGNISHSDYILQWNKIYGTYLDLMYALLYNDFDAFYKHAKEIGFSKYRKHVKALVYRNGYNLNQIHDMNFYIDFVNQDLQTKRRTKQQIQMHRIDKDVKAYFKQAQAYQPEKATQTTRLLKEVHHNVQELVGSYYGYMTRKKFLSSDTYLMAIHTLEGNLPDKDEYEQPQGFFDHEAGKAGMIDDVVNGHYKKDLDILTLHQAKGLQYKHVFLLGLNDVDFNDESVAMGKLFPSNTKYDQFLSILHDNLPKDDKRKDKKKDDKKDDDIHGFDKHDLCERIWNSSLDPKGNLIPSDAFQTMYDINVQGKLPPSKDDKNVHFVDDTHYVINHQHKVSKITIDQDNEGDPIPAITKYIDQETGEVLPFREKLSNRKMDKYMKDVQSLYRSFVFNGEFVESERKLLYVGITRSQDYMYLDVPSDPNPLLSELSLKHAVPEDYRTPEHFSRPSSTHKKSTNDKDSSNNDDGVSDDLTSAVNEALSGMDWSDGSDSPK